MSLAGASIALKNPVFAKPSLPGIDSDRITNDHFSVSFDKSKRTINISRSDGAALLTGGTVRLNLAAGQKDSLSVRSITSANYKCTTTSGSFNDQLGTGKKMTILLKDKEKKSDIEIQLSLYDHIMAITIEAICKNVSGNNLVLRSIEPFV